MFGRLRGRLDQIQGQASGTIANANDAVNMVKDLVDDLSDGVGVKFVIEPGAVQKFFDSVVNGKGGELPILIRIDPGVDTPQA